MDGFWCHPYFCSCSNQRCIACNIFPSKSREEAVERFCAGDFAHEDDFIELKTGKRYHYSQYGIEQQILRYLAHWSAEQVKRLGFDSKLVDTLAMQRTLDRMGDKYVDVFDTTLLCPNCGMKGEYRKAISPIHPHKNMVAGRLPILQNPHQILVFPLSERSCGKIRIRPTGYQTINP